MGAIKNLFNNVKSRVKESLGNIATGVGGGIGTVGGAAAGAGIGTLILPGIGTAIGAGIGTIGGAIGGSLVGKHIGNIGRGISIFAKQKGYEWGETTHGEAKNDLKELSLLKEEAQDALVIGAYDMAKSLKKDSIQAGKDLTTAKNAQTNVLTAEAKAVQKAAPGMSTQTIGDVRDASKSILSGKTNVSKGERSGIAKLADKDAKAAVKAATVAKNQHSLTAPAGKGKTTAHAQALVSGKAFDTSKVSSDLVHAADGGKALAGKNAPKISSPSKALTR